MDKNRYEAWIDLYLRDELSAEQEAEFETALLETPDLQQALEAALGIRQALLLEHEFQRENADIGPIDASLSGSLKWQPMALAASVLLAVFSTTMYWRVSNQAGDLQIEVDALRQPRGAVLTVPIDIMRSLNSTVPDVIVKKPEGMALVVLDIEASPAVRGLERVQMTLRAEDADPIMTWEAYPGTHGRILSVIDSAALPTGLVWLEMADGPTVVDRRLIEFR
jgi:hypothetical protein